MSIIQEAESSPSTNNSKVNKKGKGEMPTASHTYKVCVCMHICAYACMHVYMYVNAVT